MTTKTTQSFIWCRAQQRRIKKKVKVQGSIIIFTLNGKKKKKTVYLIHLVFLKSELFFFFRLSPPIGSAPGCIFIDSKIVMIKPISDRFTIETGPWPSIYMRCRRCMSIYWMIKSLSWENRIGAMAVYVGNEIKISQLMLYTNKANK